MLNGISRNLQGHKQRTRTRGPLIAVPKQIKPIHGPFDLADLSLCHLNLVKLYLFWRGKRSIKCHRHIEIGNFDYTEYINPLPGMESVTNVPVEEDSIIGAREPTSPMFNSEVVTREMDEDNLHHLWRRLCLSRNKKMCQKKETLTSKTLLLVREYPFPKWLTKFSTKRSLEARTRCKVRMPLYHQNKGQRWRCAWGLRIPCGGYFVWPFGCFIFQSKFYVAFGKENFPWRRSSWKKVFWPKREISHFSKKKELPETCIARVLWIELHWLF